MASMRSVELWTRVCLGNDPSIPWIPHLSNEMANSSCVWLLAVGFGGWGGCHMHSCLAQGQESALLPSADLTAPSSLPQPPDFSPSSFLLTQA